jgi:hypothetical protein
MESVPLLRRYYRKNGLNSNNRIMARGLYTTNRRRSKTGATSKQWMAVNLDAFSHTFFSLPILSAQTYDLGTKI